MFLLLKNKNKNTTNENIVYKTTILIRKKIIILSFPLEIYISLEII